MALIHLNYKSKYLDGNTDVNVLLPDPPFGGVPADFYSSGVKYPVLWLLHGTSGDYSVWLRRSNIEEYAQKKKIMVVMPSVQNTNYADWPTFANGYGAYSVLTEELMPLIYGWFPASPQQKDNFIAGNSMGGRGACTYAFNHPNRFAGAYIMSASPQDMRTHLEDRFFAKRNQNMVANAGGMEAFLASPQNLWDLTRELAEKKVALPKLYFACGIQDALAYEDFKIFRAYAEELELSAQFWEEPGYGHEWPFWNRCLQDAMDKFFPDT